MGWCTAAVQSPQSSHKHTQTHKHIQRKRNTRITWSLGQNQQQESQFTYIYNIKSPWMTLTCKFNSTYLPFSFYENLNCRKAAKQELGSGWILIKGKITAQIKQGRPTVKVMIHTSIKGKGWMLRMEKAKSSGNVWTETEWDPCGHVLREGSRCLMKSLRTDVGGRWLLGNTW